MSDFAFNIRVLVVGMRSQWSLVSSRDAGQMVIGEDLAIRSILTNEKDKGDALR